MSDWTLKREGESPYLLSLSLPSGHELTITLADPTGHFGAVYILQALEEWRRQPDTPEWYRAGQQGAGMDCSRPNQQGTPQALAEAIETPFSPLLARIQHHNREAELVNNHVMKEWHRNQARTIQRAISRDVEEAQRIATLRMLPLDTKPQENSDGKTVPSSAPLSEPQRGYAHYPSPCCE